MYGFVEWASGLASCLEPNDSPGGARSGDLSVDSVCLWPFHVKPGAGAFCAAPAALPSLVLGASCREGPVVG